jgi:lysozyme family protein
MTARNFADALARVLAHEGGYTNHPSDPGGPTNWGITIHDARRYWKGGANAADVKAMPRDVACRIYKAKYWDALRCDDLPSGVDYCAFDYGVNSGVGRAAKVLRRALALSDKAGGVNDDVVAAASRADSRKLIAAICGERLAFLMSLKTWRVFGVGWGRRVASVRAAALAMASSDRVVDVPIGQGEPERGKATVPANTASRTAGVGGTVAAGSAMLAWAPDAGTAAVIIVLTALAVIAIVVAWRWWQHHREEAPVTPILGKGDFA